MAPRLSPFVPVFLLSTFLLFPILINASVWPAPQSFTTGDQPLWISPDILFSYSPPNDAADTLPNSNISSKSIVQSAILRTKENLLNRNFVPWKFYPRNEINKFEPDSQSTKTYISVVTIKQTASDNLSKTKKNLDQANESYSISISRDGQATIFAMSYLGILYGLETFSQLFYKHSSDGGLYTNLAPIEITDSPKFPHRGLNLDVSRDWYPVADILRTIDAISYNKFNRLHLHITDSQSWPLEITSMPGLAENGAYMRGLAYSPDDITKIHTYAIERGVEAIIEIDMPGHTASIGYTYPELIAGNNAQPWATYCAEPPCGSLKLNSPGVSAFVENLFNDLLPRVSPYTAHFHTGGDEVNKQVYLLDETVRSNDTSVLRPLLQKFIDHAHAQVRAANLTPIVWEEMAVEWNLTLGSDVIVQSWLSDTSVAQITSKGHKALAGNYNYWYLDCGKGAWLNFENGDSFTKNYPFNDYCSPTKNWRLMYSYDPLQGVPADQQHLVLGGEVHIWSEQIDPINLDDMLWPRASAAGEVLWSGRQDSSGNNRSQITASPRLAEWRSRMVKRGISAGPVQMIYCTQLNATACSL